MSDIIGADDFPMPVEHTPEQRFIRDVLAELAKVRAGKFAIQPSTITGLALGEESGEAQRALLHIYEGKSGEDPLWLECVQTATMAIRLATESADRVDWPGNVAKRRRDELAALNGPPARAARFYPPPTD